MIILFACLQINHYSEINILIILFNLNRRRSSEAFRGPFPIIPYIKHNVAIINIISIINVRSAQN